MRGLVRTSHKTSQCEMFGCLSALHPCGHGRLKEGRRHPTRVGPRTVGPALPMATSTHALPRTLLQLLLHCPGKMGLCQPPGGCRALGLNEGAAYSVSQSRWLCRPLQHRNIWARVGKPSGSWWCSRENKVGAPGWDLGLQVIPFPPRKGA